MLELYAAYWDFEDMMSFTEELVAGVAMDVLGTTEFEYQGKPMSFTTPWARRTMAELASEASDARCRCTRRARNSRAIFASAASRCSRRGARAAVWPSWPRTASR
jgi:lysyl-tRNA synthetase class 2